MLSNSGARHFGWAAARSYVAPRALLRLDLLQQFAHPADGAIPDADRLPHHFVGFNHNPTIPTQLGPMSVPRTTGPLLAGRSARRLGWPQGRGGRLGSDCGGSDRRHRLAGRFPGLAHARKAAPREGVWRL